MAARRSIYFILLGAFLSLGAGYRTTNFVVEAPTREIAQRIGKYAEHYRREKAQQWLGREMPTWPQPCQRTTPRNHAYRLCVPISPTGAALG
jgi:hypothetical protein